MSIYDETASFLKEPKHLNNKYGHDAPRYIYFFCIFQTEYWEVVKKTDTLYLIRDPDCILPTDTVFKVMLQVKYKPFTAVPNIQSIRLNGRTICGTVIPEGLNR